MRGMKKHTLKRPLSLRAETVKTLAGRDLQQAGGAGLRDSWTCTLGLSCMSICPSDECTYLPPCGGGGGGGGSLSGIHCPK
jgi:hypothetical protein